MDLTFCKDLIIKYGGPFIQWAKKHPFWTGLIIVSFVGIGTLGFIHDEVAYKKPARVIENYLNHISAENYKDAFSLLSSKYGDKKYSNNLNKFKEIHSTTKRHTNIKVDFIESTRKGFLKDFVVLDKEYTVTVDVEDLFKYDYLAKSTAINSSDIFWLQTVKVKPIEKILDASIESYSLNRYFKTRMKLFKDRGEWKIDDIKLLEIGIKY